MQKKILAPLYIKGGDVVNGLDGKETAGDKDALTLALQYESEGADGLLIFDCSDGDAEHEQSIDLIRKIGREADLTMIAGGDVKRLEDVKKFLYAGCGAVYLSCEEEQDRALALEAAKRFGREKIAVCASAGKDLEFPLIACMAGEETAAQLDALAMESVWGVCVEPSRLQKLKQEAGRLGLAVAAYESTIKWDSFKLNADGLIPVVVQDYRTLEVLMVAYMNREAFERTVSTGKMTYYSRSRQTLWLKGETSGHFQYVKQLSIDCDNDTILAKVKQIGAACHTGNRSCFYRDLVKKEYRETNPAKVFEEVYGVIEDRRLHPKEGSYTNYLFDKGIDKILKKVGEEAAEIIIAAKNPDPEEIKYEISDFLYHVMVLMSERGVTWEDITEELSNR